MGKVMKWGAYVLVAWVLFRSIFLTMNFNREELEVIQEALLTKARSLAGQRAQKQYQLTWGHGDPEVWKADIELLGQQQAATWRLLNRVRDITHKPNNR